MGKIPVFSLATILLLLGPVPSVRGGIAGTDHDLSTNFEPFSDQVCAFCHTPHSANIKVQGPLWNRFVDQNQAFIPYQSPTMDTVPGQPTPATSTSKTRDERG